VRGSIKLWEIAERDLYIEQCVSVVRTSAGVFFRICEVNACRRQLDHMAIFILSEDSLSYM
jgi:hypothetical protein